MKNLFSLVLAGAVLMGTLASASAAGWVTKYASGNNTVKRIKVDGGANTIVLSQRGTQVLLLKYDNTGALSWTATYSGLDGMDNPNDLALDSSNNIYITGNSTRTGGQDIVTLKYNSAGALQWAKVYNGAANGADSGQALKVDASGNVYVAGTSMRTDLDILAIKYDTNGNQQWVSAYGNAANGADSATCLALDSSNNVFVGGSVYRGAGNSDDYAVIKFDNATGAISGVVFYNGTGSSADNIRAITIDSSDNVIVTGSSIGTADADYVTIKYNSALALQWAKRYSGGVGADTATQIFSSADGSIVVTGSSAGTGTGDDWATVKYNGSGVLQWVKRTRTGGNDVPNGLFVDSGYNVYVTGYVTGDTAGGTTGQDAYTVKYNAAGTPTFSARYNGTAGQADSGAAITVNGGEVYVAIQSTNGGGNGDIVTIQYIP